ncbi:MAG TPA: universal stress protein [Polyangiaceae bacterium]|jgi:nucleotide-binding universal stress UspA family protein|nr:universal stress protein [Polyangiaceae bacterium]
MKRILVPVDFSECSDNAFARAVELAKAFGATIDVLHVWEAPKFLPPELLIAGPGPQQTLAELSKTRAEAELGEFLNRVVPLGMSVGLAHAEEGSAATKIVEAASAGGYDLLVVGTHGRTGVERVLLGSVAERVVRHAKIPVLSVRHA